NIPRLGTLGAHRADQCQDEQCLSHRTSTSKLERKLPHCPRYGKSGDFVLRSSTGEASGDCIDQEVRERYRSRTTSPLASAAAFILEGELQLGAEGRDLALLDDQVLLDDLGDTQVAQRLGRPIHRRRCRLFPGIGAGAYELDHLVDAVGHGYLPRHGFTVSSGAGSGGGAAAAPKRLFLAVEPNTNQAVANLPNSQ